MSIVDQKALQIYQTVCQDNQLFPSIGTEGIEKYLKEALISAFALALSTIKNEIKHIEPDTLLFFKAQLYFYYSSTLASHLVSLHNQYQGDVTKVRQVLSEHSRERKEHYLGYIPAARAGRADVAKILDAPEKIGTFLKKSSGVSIDELIQHWPGFFVLDFPLPPLKRSLSGSPAFSSYIQGERGAEIEKYIRDCAKKYGLKVASLKNQKDGPFSSTVTVSFTVEGTEARIYDFRRQVVKDTSRYNEE